MQIFLFVIDGKPGYRTTLAEAQACLEDHLRDRRDVSDVWWDDERPHEARLYYYGASHSDYEADLAAGNDPDASWETTDQLIWPVHLSEGMRPMPPEPRLSCGGAELTLMVKTIRHKEQVVRIIPEKDWSDVRLRPHVVRSFAVDAGQVLADHLTSKETQA
jgi:hypothetical protein